MEKKESILKEMKEHEIRVGHLHPEHAEPEEFVRHGDIHHRKVRFGKLSVSRFGHP